MTAEQYKPIYDWFTARPAAYRALKIATRALSLVVAGGYALLVAWLAWDWLAKARAGLALSWTGYQEAADAALWQLVRCTVVPAAVFLLGTAVRAWINAPRPYQQPGFTPLIPKKTQGKSCPSRHCLCAGCIAVVGWAVHPAAGVLFTLAAVAACLTRVLAGVHSVRDVACGAALGAGACAFGLWLL